MSEITANVFNIQRFSLHDGPGIRTTVFFKGCNMHCVWCHNPESFKPSAELSFDASKCIGCMKCIEVCKSGAQICENQAHKIDKQKCKGCFECAKFCPSKAITVIGQERTLSEVFDECMKDKKYYEQGGGVTFSGGEATIYPDFLQELAKMLAAEGIHTALETNGYANAEVYKQLMPYIDLFLFDFKLYDDELHKKYTGVSNKPILENLKFINDSGKQIILRMPVIPTVNDTAEHFNAARELCNKYKNVILCEVMPYHDIGKSKWQGLMLEYSLCDIKPPSADKVAEWKRAVKQ